MDTSRLILVAGAALIVVGAAAAVQAVVTYGIRPACGFPAAFARTYCPNSLGSTPEFMGGMFFLLVGALATLYGYSQMD